MKNFSLKFRLAAVLLFILPISVFSGNSRRGSPDNTASVVFSAGAAGGRHSDFSRRSPVPAPKPSVAASAKGDFSAIPDHAFIYLNELAIKLIDASVSSIDVAMYSLTLREIPDALLRAKDRGVKIRLIMDESHVYPKMSPQLQGLIEAGGIELRTLRGTRAYGVNHNKIGVFDKAVAASGSYNWTVSATYFNFENTILVRPPVYVNAFAGYFDWMWAKARTLEQGPSPEVPEGYYGIPPQDPAPAMALNGEPVPAYLFSPGSNTEVRLSRIIAAAKNTLDVVSYTFSSKPLADAIVAAKNRGVKVRMLMDQAMAKDSAMAKYVFNSGVDFRVRGGRTDKGALHDKFAILDGGILETGSFNWTTNAGVNSFENIIFTNDAAAVKAYQAKYDWLYANSTAPGTDFFPQDDYSKANNPDNEGLEPF